MFCEKCGSELKAGAKFCSNCGHQVAEEKKPKKFALPPNIEKNINFSKIKSVLKKDKKKTMTVAAIIMILVIAAVVILPNVLVTPNSLMADGNYEEAYEKAGTNAKQNVLIENLIAYVCADARDRLENPDSFKLLDAWFDKQGNDEGGIGLRVSCETSSGGTTSVYFYYGQNKGAERYYLVSAVSNLTEETMTEDDTFVSQLLQNSAKQHIKIISEVQANVIDQDTLNRINGLSEQGLLKSISLLDDILDIFPAVSKTSTGA